MNIRQHALAAIRQGMPARFDVRAGVSGVTFLDNGEFIPFSDLNHSAELGYYRLSTHPDAERDCANENPETIHQIEEPGDDTPMYAWLDGDGDPHLIGEWDQVADLYAALHAALHEDQLADPISHLDPAWGNHYSIARAVAEAIEYGYSTDAAQMADTIRAAARAGRIRGAAQGDDGRWTVPATTFRGWLMRSQAERRGRPKQTT
jgi:hypothetical protein